MFIYTWIIFFNIINFCGISSATTPTASISAGDTIYICYSSLANNETLTQFFWNADGTYVLSDDGTILNSLHYEKLC